MAQIGVKVALMVATCICSTVCDTQPQPHASWAAAESPELHGKGPNVHCSCNCALPTQTDRQTCESVASMKSDLDALLTWKGVATNHLHHLKNSLQMVHKRLDNFSEKGCSQESTESSLIEDIVANISHKIEEATENIIFRVKGPHPLGVESGEIPDAQIYASSEFDGQHGARRARLYTVPDEDGTGAWCAKYNDADQWLQVDLGKPAEIWGVVTQGRFGSEQCVTAYKLNYSMNGLFWRPYEASGRQKVFQGNEDANTLQRHLFANPVTARFVRFLIQTWRNHICMRMEVLGRYK
ncbi:lactadherin-like [Branchiostoma floridae x Branchiostoma belcheri]